MKSPYVSSVGKHHTSPTTPQPDSELVDGDQTLRLPKGTQRPDDGSSDGSVVGPRFYDEERASERHEKGRETEKGLNDGGNPVIDSPTLGREFASPSLGLLGQTWHADSKAPYSPNSINTLATNSTSGQAERDLHVPFLPKKLWLRDHSGPSKRAEEIKVKGDARSKEAVSAFENDSSGEEFPMKSPTLHEAKQKRFSRPGFVTRGSSSLVVGLQDMLQTTGPASNTNYPPVPSKKKLARLIGEEIRSPSGFNEKRAGIVGLPTAEAENDQPTTLGGAKNRTGNSIRDSSDGLRSHPIRRSATVPTGKKVTFPSPPELEIKPEHSFLRQNTVSTPYPARHMTDVEEEGEAHTPLQLAPTEYSILKLFLENPHTREFWIRPFYIPRQKVIGSEDLGDGEELKTNVQLKKDFDDEKLLKEIREAYLAKRGKFLSTFSAREVREAKLFFYKNAFDRFEEGLTTRFPSRELNHEFEVRMLSRFRKPSAGRGEQNLILEIEECFSVLAPSPHFVSIGLKLIEGWAIWKIARVLLLVLALSITTTLLWVFLGTGGSSPYIPSTGAGADLALSINTGGFRGAGERVQAGALLGTLVLLLGWTGTGTWALLTWLT